LQPKKALHFASGEGTLDITSLVSGIGWRAENPCNKKKIPTLEKAHHFQVPAVKCFSGLGTSPEPHASQAANGRRWMWRKKRP